MKSFWNSAQHKWWSGPLALSIGYLITHFIGLTKLPVFADEAIYIRWAQLIVGDWQQYLFFPLNDGKTPLWMWLMVPGQALPLDQLWSARALAVIVGLLQVWAMMWLVKTAGGQRKAQLAAGLWVTILPFWFFHHRMALIDGLLTLLLTITFGCWLQLAKLPGNKKLSEWYQPQRVLWITLTGVSFGLALWTKLPAVLLLPTASLVALWPQKNTWWQRWWLLVSVGVGSGLGVAGFALLKFAPAFGQLFSRGGDFLFSLSDFLGGEWQVTVPSISTYLGYFVFYLTWPVLLLIGYGLYAKKHQRAVGLFFLGGLLFSLPIMLLGRTVYPRYLFPASLFLTAAAALAAESLMSNWSELSQRFRWRTATAVSLALLFTHTLTLSSSFMIYSWFQPDQIPFVSSDQTQYLYEWSSGHGITESLTLIRELSQDQTVAVATEGFFGTLPDGLTLYLHNRDVSNLYVEGIGQPVASIPEWFTTRAREYDQTLLVVNSHRMQMKLPANQLLLQTCRANNNPCLQVWDITPQISGSFQD